MEFSFVFCPDKLFFPRRAHGASRRREGRVTATSIAVIGACDGVGGAVAYGTTRELPLLLYTQADEARRRKGEGGERIPARQRRLS